MGIEELFGRWNLVLEESNIQGVTVVTIRGDIDKSVMPIGDFLDGILNKHGIRGNETKYPFRHVGQRLLDKIIRLGTERDEDSHRDLQLERDFSLNADDYTYCHHFVDTYIQDVADMFINPRGPKYNSSAAVFYRADLMMQHTDEEYDRGTGSVFSFRDLGKKSEAVYLILRHEGELLPSAPAGINWNVSVN